MGEGVVVADVAGVVTINRKEGERRKPASSPLTGRRAPLGRLNSSDGSGWGVKIDRREGREPRRRSTWITPVSERKREAAAAVEERAAVTSGAGGTGVGGGGVSGLGGGERGWFVGHGGVFGRGVVSAAMSVSAAWDTYHGMAATWPWANRGFVKKPERLLSPLQKWIGKL